MTKHMAQRKTHATTSGTQFEEAYAILRGLGFFPYLRSTRSVLKREDGAHAAIRYNSAGRLTITIELSDASPQTTVR